MYECIPRALRSTYLDFMLRLGYNITRFLQDCDWQEAAGFRRICKCCDPSLRNVTALSTLYGATEEMDVLRDIWVFEVHCARWADRYFLRGRVLQ